MNDYVTDEQRVEELKKWWVENGAYLLGGVILGLALLFGWNTWRNHQESQRAAAYDLYTELSAAVEGQSLEQAKTLVAKLQQDYGATPYAALGSMALAKLAVKTTQYVEAETALTEAMTRGKQAELQEVARLRLVRVKLALKKPDDALELLSAEWPVAYLSLTEELKGDAYLQKGDRAAARTAYDKALLSATSGIEFLRMKRDDLGEETSTEAAS